MGSVVNFQEVAFLDGLFLYKRRPIFKGSRPKVGRVREKSRYASSVQVPMAVFPKPNLHSGIFRVLAVESSAFCMIG